MARFCEGLPERATRPLAPAERARLLAVRRSWTVTALARGALLPVVLAAPVVIGAAGRVLPSKAGELLGVAAFAVAVLVAMPAAVLWAWDAVRVRRLLSRDAARGEALEFGDGPGPSLAVLPHSGRVLARDGSPADLSVRVDVGDAAPPPADAPTYGVSAEAADFGALREHGWVRRALVPAEREELRRIAAILRKTPIRLPLFTVLYAALFAKMTSGPRDLVALLLAAIAGLTLVAGWGRWLRGRQLAVRLLADEAEGWIVRATAGELAGTEVLPSSGAHWTKAGAPAAWRLRASRRR